MKGSYGKNDNLPFDRNVTALSVELPEIYAEQQRVYRNPHLQ
jgi:hypothetical protein